MFPVLTVLFCFESPPVLFLKVWVFCSLFQKNQPVECNNESDDDDIPQLSAHALAALQDFYNEQEQRDDVSPSQENAVNIDEDWV